LKSVDLIKNYSAAGCSYRWSYPVVKLSQQRIRTCCQVTHDEVISSEQAKNENVFFNSDYLIARKMEMLQGTKHSDCSACWKLEAAGMPSMRSSARPMDQLFPVELLDKLKNDTLSNDDLAAFSNFQKADILEIQLDNICDLACAYCNEEYSTTWAKKKNLKLQSNKPEGNAEFQTQFWDWYRTVAHEINGICIIGGEPLASPIFTDVLGKLLDIHSQTQRSTQVFLSITSNFNAPAPVFAKFLDKAKSLRKYFNLNINASCEAYGERSELIREGLKWERFDSNVRTLLSYMKNERSEDLFRMDFAFHAAQNAMSIEGLPEFLKYAADLEFEYQVPINLIQNIVSFPAFLSAQSVLPKHFGEYCLAALSVIENHKDQKSYNDSSTWPKYGEFITSIMRGLETREVDPDQTAQFKKWFFQQSEQRKEKFKRLFPRLFDDVIMA
jgi:organic radical activating enzyme